MRSSGWHGNIMCMEAFRFEPVQIEIRADHLFKRSARAKTKCECGAPKLSPVHGQMSYNEFGSGANHFVYQATKVMWEDAFLRALKTADMPSCDNVLVEGRMTFPDRGKKDQGNFRFAIEKFLGDALQRGGYIPNDDWTRYQFGNLDYRYEKGVKSVDLLLMPNALGSLADATAVPVVDPAQHTLFAA